MLAVFGVKRRWFESDAHYAARVRITMRQEAYRCLHGGGVDVN